MKWHADLSIGPASDELHHPVCIQVKGVDAHCMILRLGGDKREERHEEDTLHESGQLH